MRLRRHHNNDGRAQIKAGKTQRDAKYFERRYADPDYHQYEMLKRELQAQDLTPRQYTDAVQKIARRLGI